MKNRIVMLIASAVTAGAITCTPAPAQSSTQMIRNQINLQQIGDRNAMAAANVCYNYSLRLRNLGYRGPISCGVTPHSLSDSIQAAGQAGRNYIQSTQRAQTLRQDAVTSTSNAITHGCSNGYLWNGYRWVCQ